MHWHRNRTYRETRRLDTPKIGLNRWYDQSIHVRFGSRLCENSEARFGHRRFFSISPLRKNIIFGRIYRKKRIEKTILRTSSSSEFSHSLGQKLTSTLASGTSGLPQQRTFKGAVGMSEKCQSRKSWLHSITSSARVSTAVGTLRSRDLATLRFKANSNAVGRSIGISPGATPRNT